MINRVTYYFSLNCSYSKSAILIPNFTTYIPFFQKKIVLLHPFSILEITLTACGDQNKSPADWYDVFSESSQKTELRQFFQDLLNFTIKRKIQMSQNNTKNARSYILKMESLRIVEKSWVKCFFSNFNL